MKRIQSFLQPVILVIVILLLVSQACDNVAESNVGLYLDTLELAEQKLQAYVDEGKLPFVSTLVLKDGKVAHRFLYGNANIEEERAVEENDIFRIYSMSKPITAAALMMLYDEGKFELDDPVEMFVPAYKETKVWVDGEEVDQEEKFTVRHLLTHTAGFCYGWGKSYVDSLYTTKGESIWTSTLEEMIEYLAEIPLKNQPGSKYEYSVSIDVAGYLVEVLSGQSFDVFLEERLFGPLGMDDSGFEVQEEDFDRYAMIYTPGEEGEGLKPVPDMTNPVKEDVILLSGGGGLVSTIEDYAKFGEMLLNGGELDGVRVLQESTVELITTNQMKPPAQFENIGYGLGGYANEEKGRYGWNGAASTSFLLDKKNNMVVLAMTQYVPFMGVKYADVYKQLVDKAIVQE